jgi:hypothetical protein
MLNTKRIWWIFLPVVFILSVSGCATFNPRPVEEIPFRERAQTQDKGNVRVTAAVPSAEESKRLFGVDMYKRGVQPIWLEIENKDEEPVYFLPIGLDPNYFSPIEAAYVNHFGFKTPANEEMNRFFYEQRKDIRIAPASVRSGFVYTPVDEGTKAFNVDLMGEDHEIRTFTFFINVPGIRPDHQQVDFEALYSKDQIVSYDKEGLRKALESLPCCVTGKDGKEYGDPLNLVVIMSFIFGGRYRYSPVSPLYVYGRRQDAAFQKARGTIHERNHLRLWLSPMRFKGNPVWVGQISRDIGVRFTTKTILTHKIDPDVDETRDFLIQDLWYSQGLKKLAYVKGVGPAPISEPRGNLTGDPYFTDGLRAVLWVSSDLVELDAVELGEWEIPLE